MKALAIFIFLIAGIIIGNLPSDYSFILLLGSLALSALTVILFFSGSILFTPTIVTKRVFSAFSLSSEIHLKKPLVFIFCLLFFCFGYISIQFRIHPDPPPSHISQFVDTENNIITGRVVSFAKHYIRKYEVNLLCRTIQTQEGRIENTSGRIKLSIYGSPDRTIGYGDKIRFKASIRSIRNFRNPGGFDYKRFLQLRGIFGSAWAGRDKIEILTDHDKMGAVSRLIRKIESLRVKFFDFVLEKSSYSQSRAILASIVTGKKEVISHETRDLFSKAGISHLLAISGLHLSIVSFLFFSLLYRIYAAVPFLLISGKAKKIAGISTIVPLVLYSFFTGFSPSCQRALIMLIFLIIAFIREKEKDILSSLSSAGILILIIDSAALFSISFQLSFAAVVFIVYGVFFIKAYFPFLVKKNMLSKLGLMICITFAAGAGTSPLTAHYFNTVSVIAVISNLAAIPVLGFIVLPLGLICLILFSWFPMPAEWIVQICSQLVSSIFVLSRFLTDLPFAWSRSVTLQWSEIAAIYAAACALALILRGYRKFGAAVFVSLFLLLIFNAGISRALQSGESDLRVTILDVGQGNSSLIQTPEGETILVDGGGFSNVSTFDTGRYVVAPFLWKKRVKNIDYVVLTHPESDHLNGLVFILDNFNVKNLIKNSDTRNSLSYESMMEVCRKHDITIYNPSAHGKNIQLKSVTLHFFDSLKDRFSYNLNNNSLVFKMVYGEFSMIFPGDILEQRETNLSRRESEKLDSDILLAPHHGSSSSSTLDFLKKVNPSAVVISCGWRNRYGFPDSAVLQRYKNRGAEIFRTDKNGAVMISSRGKHYTIDSHHPSD